MRNQLTIRLTFSICFLLASNVLLCGQDNEDWKADLKIELQDQQELLDGQAVAGVQVSGLPDALIKAIDKTNLNTEEGRAILKVSVGEQRLAMLGKLVLKDRLLVFEPRFSLDPSEFSYQAVLDLSQFQLIDGPREPFIKIFPVVDATPNSDSQVAAVSPRQTSLPQNLLRMYLSFADPMAQGNSYEHIQFLNSQGEPIPVPFLEIPQELWSTDGKRLTLLFDPGRIKRGLARNEQHGAPFKIGETYTIVVKRGWRTANKSQLNDDFRHTFTIVQPDRDQPSVDRWKVEVPQAGSVDPLAVRFDEPMDVAMLQHAIVVRARGKAVQLSGEVIVADDGTAWQLTPEKPWQTGDFVLDASPRLEDRAGNSLAQPFERKIVDGAARVEEVAKAKTTLEFRVGPARQARPNVVVILADDLGWSDLGCQGSRFYESPNIDRISKEGMRFDAGYAACQVCSPSRAAIMTGKSPARLKITDWIGAPSGTDWKRNTKLLPAFYKRNLPAEETTIAEAFQEGGYKTFFAGKWHLGSQGSFPEDHGFDVNVGGHSKGSPPGGYFSPYKNPKMKDGPVGECLPVRLGQETASFIEANREEPFFAFLSFYSVHGPIQSSEELWKKYRIKAKFDARMTHVDKRFEIDRTMPVRQVQDHPLYAGMVESMDDGVGLVLDKLDELGLAENTIVIFTSDNGGVSSGDGFATCNWPFRGGKGRQWEGGIREPFLVRWPARVKAGGFNETPVIGTDIYPTLLDLTGLPARPEQTLDGVSIRPLLEGGTIPARPLVWHYPHYGNQGGEPSSIIRKGDWKLIRYHEDKRLELYNIAEDPSEKIDVADLQADRVATLAGELDRALVEMGAERAVTNPNFDAAAYSNWQKQQIEKRLPALEKQHARFHDENFQPKGGWWEQRR